MASYRANINIAARHIVPGKGNASHQTTSAHLPWRAMRRAYRRVNAKAREIMRKRDYKVSKPASRSGRDARRLCERANRS